MAFHRPKISVFGAGFVGATVAQRCADRELGDVLLIDIVEDMPQGKGLDMFESSPVERFDARVNGSNKPADVAGSDVVVVTSGIARKPGMSRDDLLTTNAKIVQSVADSIREHAPNAIVIMVTNPLDVMSWVAHKRLGFPKNRVMGMAGVLDSARMASFVAMELNCSVKDISPMVLGGHGDTMVPLPRYTTVSGIPITDLLPADRIEAINDRTRKGGAEIVALLKTGSAYYAPGSSVVAMVESIVKDQRRILPTCALLEGEYGLKDTWQGVPCMLGKNGIEKIYELKLNDAEQKLLATSNEHVAGAIRQAAQLLGM
ncbi:MAG: malate dehydrogenase [Planctomycetota bacterium]|nr:malate dehydrogenase [Planctomycetota bacterium]